MAIHPGAELAKETVTQKFVHYSDQLIRVAAVATVYRDSNIRPFEESYEPWNEVDQQMLQYTEPSAADCLRSAFLHLRCYIIRCL